MSAFWDKLKRGKEEAEEKAPVSDASKDEKKQEKEKQSKEEKSKDAVKKDDKKDTKPAKKKEQPEKLQEKKDESKGAKAEKKGKKSKKKKKGFPKEQAVLIARTIIKPKVSEAAMNQQTMAKYVFYVRQNASKNEVAKAVKAMYGKEVRKVNVVNYSPQRRTFRGYKGMVKGYKKAIVTLEKGQTIDVFSE